MVQIGHLGNTGTTSFESNQKQSNVNLSKRRLTASMPAAML